MCYCGGCRRCLHDQGYLCGDDRCAECAEYELENVDRLKEEEEESEAEYAALYPQMEE